MTPLVSGQHLRLGKTCLSAVFKRERRNMDPEGNNDSYSNKNNSTGMIF